MSRQQKKTSREPVPPVYSGQAEAGHQPYLWLLEKHISKAMLPIYLEWVNAGLHPDLMYHDHDASEIVFVLSGTTNHIVQKDGKKLCCPIRKGDVLVLHPGVVHAYEHTASLELYNLVYNHKKMAIPLLDGYSMDLFKCIFPYQENISPEVMVAPVLHLNDGELHSFNKMMVELQKCLLKVESGSQLESIILFLKLVVTLSKLGMKEPKNPFEKNYRVSMAIDLINHKYAAKITLEELAKISNMSPRTFSRQFRIVAGMSPIQYLLKIRLEHVVEMLKYSDNDLTSIALKCGFCDGNHMIRQFKKSFHKTPGEIRKILSPEHLSFSVRP